MLAVLSRQRLAAAALDGRIVLAADAALAWLLDSCCVGRSFAEGGGEAQQQACGGDAAAASSSGAHGGDVCTRVRAAAGSNVSDADTQQQYQQHLVATQLRQQRRRRGRPQVAPPAQVDAGSTGEEAMQLVQLSFQEAAFLCLVLHCCAVVRLDAAAASAPVSHQQTPLTPPELWAWCCEHSQGGAEVFVSRYAAYHHLRSLGWLPLPGLMYGGDYVVYQLHPELSHSDFVVTVMVEHQLEHQQQQELQEQQQQPQESTQDGGSAGNGGAVVNGEQQPGASSSSSSSSTQLAWLDACIMHRLARQVLKQMLLLYVVVPPGLQLRDPACMQQMQVREVLVQRWVPGGARLE
jgi:hypothetical protein